MDIFFLRHFESIKNTQITFSSIDDKEELTDEGILKGKEIANNINEILGIKKLTVKNIYCANSIRAKHSAEIIATAISKDTKIQTYNDLLSTKSKELMGKTKTEVRKKNPQFIRELSLYDAGIYNSYNFHRDINKNMKKEYEIKVCKCIEKIINNNEDETAKIICLHNSSITAIVINIARNLYDYPNDYYGKVVADNGKLFWLHCENGTNDFLIANCDSKTLLDIIKEKTDAS